MIVTATMFWMAGLASLTGEVQAQDTQESVGEDTVDPRVPIVVQGRREERRAKQTRRRDNRMMTEQTYVGSEQVDTEGPDMFTQTVDWTLLGMVRAGEANNPLDRYAHAWFMAKCAVDSVGEKAADYVDLDWAGEYPLVVEAFEHRHKQCVNAAVRAAPVMMVNAALAEQVVVRYVPEPPLYAQGVDGAKAERFIHGADGQAPDSDLATIGRCLAVYVPGFGYDMLFTNPGTKEERDALDSLYAAAPECGLQARPRKVSPVYQRNAIAMGLFAWYGMGAAERGAPVDES